MVELKCIDLSVLGYVMFSYVILTNFVIIDTHFVSNMIRLKVLSP